VSIKGDTTVEPNETFTVTLSGVTGASVTDGQAVGTIRNDDSGGGAAPRSDVDRRRQRRGRQQRQQAVTFTVQLSQAAAGNVSYNIATADGTATPAATTSPPASTARSFRPGSRARPSASPSPATRLLEANERFKVNLTGVSRRQRAGRTGIGNITNDD
jgi:hypothetical protein